MRLVVIGKQGAGKGTQAFRLAGHYGVPHVSTGDIFRAAVRSEAEFGGGARAFMDAGNLVPDDVVIDVVRSRLAQSDAAGGFVLDGFPRNLTQAAALEDLLKPEEIDVVLELAVPTDEVLARLSMRRVCTACGTTAGPGSGSDAGLCVRCGGSLETRHDDTGGAIARRLALYEEQTQPLLARYGAADKLAVVVGIGSRAEVTQRLIDAVDHRMALR